MGVADYDATMWAINPSNAVPYLTQSDGKTPCAFPAIFSPGTASNRCDLNHWWSAHTGGGNFVMCDGSVRFFDYSAGSTIIPALSTRSKGEAVSWDG